MRDNAFLLPYIREDVYGLGPNDPQALGWEIKKLGVDKQWSKSRGAGVVIAVIDTGCDPDHPDIKKNLIGSYNFINNTPDATDRNGHGSHVCGTIAAIDNGKGIVGVAPESKILALKALNDHGNGQLSHIANAIKYAADHNADIITMSLGSTYKSLEIKKSIDYAAKKGCLIFCAAGNSGVQADIMYPAKFPKTISIGAIDQNFQRTNFTCSGDSLDFLSPGVDIMSIVPKNSYALMTGTSMSNPFASGVAALYLSEYKKLNNGGRMTRDQMMEKLKKNAIPLANKKQNIRRYQGFGIIKPIL